MEKITSFCIDHTTLEKGVYISLIDGDITTFDIRTKKPNGTDFLDQKALHTIEHLFATFARNCEYKDNVIYFGPMGCRTGFYFLTRNLDNQKVVSLIKDAFNFIANYKGEIPGNTAIECGNYLEHNLELAVAQAKEFLEVLKNVNPNNLNYL